MSTSRIIEHPAALTQILRRLAVDAGERIMDHYRGEGYADPMRKKDGSPVTLADQEAEAMIADALHDISSDIPMIGEEAFEAGNIPDISGHKRFWLVDALDGTREFVNGDTDFTVNIALIEDGRPAIGVIYLPYAGELYSGYGPGTAVRWQEDTGLEKEINARRAPRGGLTVATSKYSGKDKRQEELLEGYKIEKILRRGSSLKYCLIAAGKADIYPRFGDINEWDTAAGDAILRSAGGVVIDINTGEDLAYGKADNGFRHNGFIATSGDVPLPY